MPAFSNSQAFAVVESELGVPFGDVYELVEPEPIAAASIGQASSALVLRQYFRGPLPGVDSIAPLSVPLSIK